MAERDWHLYLKDMRVFAERAIRYSDELTRAQFEASQLVQDAILRNIELIIGGCFFRGRRLLRSSCSTGVAIQATSRE